MNATLEGICRRSYEGVSGLISVTRDEHSVDRTAVVFIGTHGDEVRSGMLLIQKILDGGFPITTGWHLLVGVGNPRASLEGKYFLERNMNRQPMLPDNEWANSHEGVRSAELKRVLSPLPNLHILDVHATNGPSSPCVLGISSNSETDRLVRALSPAKALLNVGRIQATQGTMTLPFSGIFNPATALEVEVGMSGTFQSQANALALFAQWAAAIGHLYEAPPEPVQQEKFHVVDSLMWPDLSYRLADERFLKEFAHVEAGEILMVSDSGAPVKNRKEGFLMWCPEGVEPKAYELQKEAFFVVQPV